MGEGGLWGGGGGGGGGGGDKYLKRGSKLSYFQRGWALGSFIFQQGQ